MDKDKEKARNRKPESASTSGSGSAGQHEDRDDKEKGKDKKEKEGLIPTLYHNFVESLESALHSMADGPCCQQSKLPSFTLEGIAQFIKTGKPENVIVMTGAGISTAAGIPDFRSPGSGLYDNLQKYNLPDPQAIFEIGFFRKNPEPFFALAKELVPEHLKPTRTHYFIRLLEKKGILKRWYTQNIDSLEYLTGIPEDKVVTAHGSFRQSTCLKCKQQYDYEWTRDKVLHSSNHIPRCEKDNCNGIVKPNIVFFGENLPRRFFECAMTDFPKCDLLIIIGTSLIVQPFAGMVHEVNDDCPRLLINMEAAGKIGSREKALGIPGLCYDSNCNKRYFFF
ncbi:hypothetical protein WR25_26713 isoform C [Diploscapter pachys]|uniref:Deacetylase sirtuin-type domain-containing protein n=1 Tax=Diploscapter pachys TaxID=2018661 RepID=A0A2A2L8Z0_9BILA|nr:hypothetical protein WR25_26713 isoform C [Diploscapter pachys]